MFHGAGADTDIIVASAKAYLRAINRMLAARRAIAESGSRVARTGAGAERDVLAERAS